MYYWTNDNMRRLRRALTVLACLGLAGCAGTKKPLSGHASADAKLAASANGRLSPIRRQIVELADREWTFFGRQLIELDADEERIPHVGKWEDDGEPYSVRVNWYWQAVGQPQFDGNDCREPWSAAFISFIMKEAGLLDYQFPRAEAHRDYLTRITENSGSPDAAFTPRSLGDYRPNPGDLICATRGSDHELLPRLDDDFRLILYNHAKLHCDIVVHRDTNKLAVIGGNVRNSVSKTILTLDRNGYLQPTRRRPWFMAVENRL